MKRKQTSPDSQNSDLEYTNYRKIFWSFALKVVRGYFLRLLYQSNSKMNVLDGNDYPSNLHSLKVMQRC